MQRNSVISLRPASGTWQRVVASGCTDAEAAYGCVDWYLYQEPDAPAPAHRASPCPAAASPGIAAALPDEAPAALVERAAAMARAAAAQATQPAAVVGADRSA